jgi:hypothetical protein
MKQILYLTTILLLAGCEQEDITRYDSNRAAIEFNSRGIDFSLMKPADTVNIAFNIVGYSVDRDREASFLVVADSTSAVPEQYQVIDATVPAGSYRGTLRVRVENNDGPDFQDAVVYFQVGENDDFIAGSEGYEFFRLFLTNKLVRPAEWTPAGMVTRRYLGSYSTAYYHFIIETTGVTRFPFYAVAGVNGGKSWDFVQRNAFLENLRAELRALNAARAREGEGPLLHDDGEGAGKEIIVGHQYTK